jgi:hypothetical protein
MLGSFDREAGLRRALLHSLCSGSPVEEALSALALAAGGEGPGAGDPGAGGPAFPVGASLGLPGGDPGRPARGPSLGLSQGIPPQPSQGLSPAWPGECRQGGGVALLRSFFRALEDRGLFPGVPGLPGGPFPAPPIRRTPLSPKR